MLLPILAFAATIGVSNADYPPAALSQLRDGVVGVQYVVDPSGRVSRCEVSFTSGWSDLDQATCAAILKRGRFEPKTDDTGHPTSDVRQLRYRWTLPPGSGASHFPPMPVEEQLSVAALPKDATRPTVNIAFQVDTEGKIGNCSVAEGEGTGSAALDRAACSAVAKGGNFPVVKGWTGHPIAYDRVITIIFVAANSAQAAAHQ